MSEQVEVLRLHGVGDMQLHYEPFPTPANDEVIIRVSSVGICGSDLHWFGSAGIGDAQLEKPLILGHEFSGIVEDPSSALNGKRVAIDPAIACRECEFCIEGNTNFCENLRFAGHGEQDGALRQYLAWPERNLHPLPEEITAEEGALLEPLGVALHAVELGKIRPGFAVGVFGVGPIGLMIIQLVKLAGASEILVTDRLEHRLDAALKIGATSGYLVDQDSKLEDIQSAFGGSQVLVAFEAAGDNQAVETAIMAAKPGGKIILVGIPEVDRTAFSASTARRKGLTIKLSRRMRYTYPRAIQLVQDGHVDLQSLVTARYPLVAYEEAFQAAHARRGLKTVINIHPE
jgi:L-iditol 2-dehydrogenase